MRNFQQKLFLIVFLLSFLSSFIFSFLALSDIKKNTFNEKVFSLQAITQFLNNYFSKKVGELKETAIDLSKKEELFSQNKEKIEDLIKAYPYFSDLLLLSPDGKTIFSLSNEFYGDWGRNNYFLEATEKKEIVFSDISFQISSPKLSFFVFLPVLSREEPCVVVLRVSADYLLDFLKETTKLYPDFLFLVTNSQNKIVFSSFAHFLGATLPLEDSKEGLINFSLLEKTFKGHSEKLELMGDTKLIVAQSDFSFFEPYFEIRRQQFFYLGVILFFCLLFSFLFSFYFAQPLEKIMSTLDAVLEGKLEERIKIKRKDELGTLANKLNQLFQTLKESYLKLEEEKKIGEMKERKFRQEITLLKEVFNKELEEKTKELQNKLKELQESRKAILNILEDVEEEKKKAERERDKTLNLIRNMTDGILLFDNAGRLSLINPQAETFFKIKGEEAVGKSISELASLADFKAVFDLVGNEIKKIFREEVQIKEGMVLEITTVPIAKENEKLGTLLIAHDVSREKMVERIKTEFVSVAAHQLRTPLSAIKWTLKMFLDGDLGKITPEQAEFLKKAYQSNERMINLINDLLNVTRIEEGRYLYSLTPVQLEEVCLSVFSLFEEEIKRKGLKFSFQKPKTPLPEVRADKEKIKLVIQNLVENAVKYTLPGKKIVVKLGLKNGEVLFSIKDEGIGIPKDQQERIFTKFFRGANALKMETDGTGLGLFISKNIIEAHGGKIWFKSEENKGSTFYFTLPVL